MKIKILILLVLLSGCSKPNMIEEVSNERIAGGVVDYYYCQGVLTSYKTVLFAIDSIERFMPKSIEKVFDTKDIIALIMLESNFRTRAVSCKNAVGLMQVTHVKEYLREIDNRENEFDIRCNIDMGLRILETKYKVFKDKKTAIIGYNGIVYDKDKNIIDDYYNNWQAHRNVVEEIYVEAKANTYF